MKLSTFLSCANAVPGQEVLAAGWQTGTFCSASWGRIATAKRLGAGVRNVKEGGALTALVGLAAKFLLAASPSSFGHTHCHTADQTRARRERETDATLTARPPVIREQIFCHDTLRRALLAASWLAASTWKEGWIRCWSHGFPWALWSAPAIALAAFPRRVHKFPSSPDLGKRGKGKVLSLACPVASRSQRR